MDTTTPSEWFSARLRRLREARGLTWQALADAAGVHVDLLHRFVRGDRRNPSLDTLCGLANALGVTLDQLTGRAALPKRISEKLDSSLDND